MTYFVKTRGSHLHRWFIDAQTGDHVCLCGAVKGKDDKKRKYHNETQEHNGVHYHSKFEANYAAELDRIKQAGQIKDWRRQVKLDLRVNGQHITNYYIDFVVDHLDGSHEFVECKGMETKDWIIKWRILEATFDDFKQSPDDTMTLVKESNWGPPRPRRAMVK